jgi:hypothetical protein
MDSEKIAENDRKCSDTLAQAVKPSRKLTTFAPGLFQGNCSRDATVGDLMKALAERTVPLSPDLFERTVGEYQEKSGLSSVRAMWELRTLFHLVCAEKKSSNVINLLGEEHATERVCTLTRMFDDEPGAKSFARATARDRNNPLAVWKSVHATMYPPLSVGQQYADLSEHRRRLEGLLDAEDANGQ